MFETIDPRSVVSLRDQIAARLTAAIASGELEPGAELPSLNRLAVQLRVGPAAASEAYQELARKGLLEFKDTGEAIVKAVSTERRSDLQVEQAVVLVESLFLQAQRFGLPDQTVRGAVEALL
jgi:GntR family transcriptional regulator